MAHAHRQLPEHGLRRPFRTQAVPEFAERPEVGPGVLRVLEPRRQEHEAGKADRTTAGGALDQASDRVHGGAVLGGLARHVHLYEDVRGRPRVGGRAVHRVQHVASVDRVDARERDRRLPGLVRLEMPDEMPAHPEIPGRVDLLEGFLHAVLAEVLLAGRDGGADVVHRAGLRHRDQAHVFRPAAGTLGRPSHPLANVREAKGNIGVAHGPAEKERGRRRPSTACDLPVTRSPRPQFARFPVRKILRSQDRKMLYFFNWVSIALTWAAY